MKKQFSFITALLFMLLSCFFSFGELAQTTAKAAMPGYSGQNCIYYYCDLYPSIDNTTLTNTYGPTPAFFLDRQALDNQEFTQLVNSGYFSSLEEGQTVIIDIKRFIPTSLGVLIGNLKNQGCTVILNTSQYLNCTSDFGADEHTESTLERYEAFIDNVICEISAQNGNSPIQLLLDKNFFNIENISDLDTLISNCQFSKILIEGLAFHGYIFNSSEGNSNKLIRPLLLMDNGVYINLIDGGTETLDDNITTCALGCTNLDDDFYDALFNLQSISKLQASFMMEGTPINYSSSGLSIVTEFDLASRWGWEADEASDLIEYIDPYIF